VDEKTRQKSRVFRFQQKTGRKLPAEAGEVIGASD
jgi:hypothetical protein